jgi:hypothetical protein
MKFSTPLVGLVMTFSTIAIAAPVEVPVNGTAVVSATATADPNAEYSITPQTNWEYWCYVWWEPSCGTDSSNGKSKSSSAAAAPTATHAV